MTIQITKVSTDFSTAPQISVDDIAEIAQLGFKTIINNRPDAEGGAEQPVSKMLEDTAKQHGLAYVYIPVVPNNILPNQIEAFAAAFSLSAKPVLGFCRTGNRAGNLYQLAQTNQGQQSAPKGLMAWLKSKCLITRLWRWCAPKCSLMVSCCTHSNKN
jgi:uncharacterized protein (TIGR01244 family)